MIHKKDTLERKKIKDFHKRIAFWGTPEKGYSDSGLFKFLKHVKTKDEHDPMHPVKKMPYLTKWHLQVIFMFMLHYPLLAIPKSRQIMISWAMATFACWFARTAKHRLILWQSKKEEDANKMVSLGDKNPIGGRISFIEANLPADLRDPHIRAGQGNKVGALIYSPKDRTIDNLPIPWQGSTILAIPQGADQIRSNTATLLLGDECGFQDEFEAAVGAAKPALTGGGRGVFASSVNPGFFNDMVLDGQFPERLECEQYPLPPMVSLAPGMKTWTTPAGVQVLEVHYSSDPDKRPGTTAGDAWLKEAVKGYVGGFESPRWRREMEIDYHVLGGDPVFPFLITPSCPIFTRRKDDDEIKHMMVLYAGYDYGTRSPGAFVVWGIDERGHRHAVWELYEPCENYKDHCRKIKACPYWNEIQWIRCDPSMAAKNIPSAKGLQSVIELFREEGVYLQPGRRGQDVTIAMRFLGDYWADPKNPTAFITDACPQGKRELQGLRWAEHTSQAVRERTNDPEKIVQKNNHWFDATAVLFDGLPTGRTIPDMRPKRYTPDWISKKLDDIDGRKSKKGYVCA